MNLQLKLKVCLKCHMQINNLLSITKQTFQFSEKYLKLRRSINFSSKKKKYFVFKILVIFNHNVLIKNLTNKKSDFLNIGVKSIIFDRCSHRIKTRW